MCFVSKKRFRNEERAKKWISSPKKAKEDFYVYKWFEVYIGINGGKYLCSPYKYFRYDRGFLYYEDDKDKQFTYNIRWNWKINNRKDYYVEIEKGFHSYKTRYHAQTNEPFGFRPKKLIRCRIPKGSLYYINDKYVVSNQIIIP